MIFHRKHTFERFGRLCRTGMIWPTKSQCHCERQYWRQCFDPVCVLQSIRPMSSRDIFATTKFRGSIPTSPKSLNVRIRRCSCCNVSTRISIHDRHLGESLCNKWPLSNRLELWNRYTVTTLILLRWNARHLRIEFLWVFRFHPFFEHCLCLFLAIANVKATSPSWNEHFVLDNVEWIGWLTICVQTAQFRVNWYQDSLNVVLRGIQI